MGKKSVPAPPPPPNPGQLANLQTQSNLTTALASAFLNNPSVVTPFGSSVTTPTGSVNVGGFNIPTFTQRQTVSPEIRSALDKQFELAGGVSDFALSGLENLDFGGLDPSGLPALRRDFGEDALRLEESVFQRGRGLLDPVFNQQRNALDVRLSERGIPLGSEISDIERGNLNRAQNEAFENLALDAVGRGFGLQNQFFNQDLAARGQLFDELATSQALPFNQLATLLGTAPGVPLPQFAGFQGSQIPGTDVIGAGLGSAQLAQNQWLAQMQAAQQARSGFLGGLFGLGADIGSALVSSREFKDETGDAPKVLDKLETLPLKTWRYKEHIGPYAEDFAERFGGDGKTISGATAWGVVLKAIQELRDEVKDIREMVNGS